MSVLSIAPRLRQLWVQWIQRWRVRRWSPGRGTAILILPAIAVVAITIFLAFAVPPVARNAESLGSSPESPLTATEGSSIAIRHAAMDHLKKNGGYGSSSITPIFHLDHIYFDAALNPKRLQLHQSPAARYQPLVADLHLQVKATAEPEGFHFSDLCASSSSYNNIVTGESSADSDPSSTWSVPKSRFGWKVAALLAVLAAVLPGLGSTLYRVWPRRLVASFPPALPAPWMAHDELRLRSPSRRLWAQVSTFSDELSAYLRFEYLRSLQSVDDNSVLLTSTETGSGPAYRIYLSLQDNLLAAVPYLAQLRAQRFIGGFSLEYPNQLQLEYARAQTSLFVAAYNQPIRHKLENLPRSQLTANVARFLLFKAKTDRRVREQIQPVPSSLSGEQARELAADIIAVAHFYSLPLDFFLGIGAMENNFLDVQGDLEHTTWKRLPQPGDIVLKRRRGRVLVRNYSIGVWQITRETLRYAHDLYLKDKRDYTKLPERLGPPKALDLDKVDSHVLTTYAGLLFRDLLDRFGGDVQKAVAAYNGGVRDPNLQYASGVAMVATYARRVLEQAAYVNGRAIAHTTLIMARR